MQNTPAAPVRQCRRCLIKDLNSENYSAILRGFLLRLDEDEKTPASDYAARLAACTSCDALTNGTCAECGCFVEMRAAVRENHCPAVHPMW